MVVEKYLMMWVEERALFDNSFLSMVKFIYEQIIMRYGIPIHLTSDQGGHFMNHVIKILSINIYKKNHSIKSLLS